MVVTDPWFYLTAVPAVLIYGIGKGGLGGALGIIAVPLMALVASPTQAAAIHAGSGPASIYLLPLRLDKSTLIATMAVLFAIINLFKFIPYAMLGEFDTTNLMTAMLLIPLAPVGVYMGVWLLHRVSQEWVYRLCYIFLFISGVKLSADGYLAL